MKRPRSFALATFQKTTLERVLRQTNVDSLQGSLLLIGVVTILKLMFTWKMNYGGWDSMPLYFWWVMIPLLVWDVVWKGVALWKSARHAQKGWFIALLIVNSAGILPIIYLAFFQKRKK